MAVSGHWFRTASRADRLKGRVDGPGRRSGDDLEVILRSDHPEFRRFHQARDERILVLRSLREFRRAVDRWVDVSAKRPRQLVEYAEHVAVTERVADDHEIDVASGLIGGLGHRAVDERCADVRPHPLQGIAQGLRESDRLQHDVPQLAEKRR